MTDVSSLDRRRSSAYDDESAASGQALQASKASAAESPLALDLGALPWRPSTLAAAAYAGPKTGSASSPSTETPISARPRPAAMSDAALAKETTDLQLRASILAAVPTDGRVDPEKVAPRLAALQAETTRRDDDKHSCDTAKPTLVDTVPQHSVLTVDELASCTARGGVCLSADQKTALEAWRQTQCRETGRDPFVLARTDPDTVDVDRSALARQENGKRQAVLDEIRSNPLAALAVLDVASRNGSVDEAYSAVEAAAPVWGVATAMAGVQPGAVSARGAITQPEETRRVDVPPARERTSPEINEKHLFEGEINASNKATGVHSAPLGRLSPTAQIVPGTEEPPDANGVYEARVRVFNEKTGQWKTKQQKSSFFPREWSAGRVTSEIRSAFDGHKPMGGFDCKDEHKNLPWKGVSPSGVTISGFVDNKGRIVTAYPKRENSP